MKGMYASMALALSLAAGASAADAQKIVGWRGDGTGR